MADASLVLGSRPAALVRELTKMHEQVQRGTLDELATSTAKTPPKGEIVLVIGGAIHDSKVRPLPHDLAEAARLLMGEGMERKAALSQVAREAGVPRRAVFDALVDEDPSGTS